MSLHPFQMQHESFAYTLYLVVAYLSAKCQVKNLAVLSRRHDTLDISLKFMIKTVRV